MILCDFSQLLHSHCMVQIHLHGLDLDCQAVANMIIGSIKKYATTHIEAFGKVAVCRDGNSELYWRKQVFRHYKAERMKEGDKWEKVFQIQEFCSHNLAFEGEFPVIRIDHAEADDVIAVLAEYLNPKERVLILSADKDFIQLQRLYNVEQFSPIQKQWIKHSKPNWYRKEHILRGDRGDGIPNFLSQDDCFVAGIKQKSIMTKKLEEWIPMRPDDFCTTEEMKHGYERNRSLIDFNFIPTYVKKEILEEAAALKII